ncbi:MAG: hypothetical protein H9535_21945 [Ignavibacteria bacterium]|nr:hypothetical protein [Ignavibacteria bacterium]
METRFVRKTFGWIVVGGFVGLLAVAGLQLYLHSNLSAQEKISQEAGLFHENIETALTSVNAQQSALIEAAGVMRLDARALGAAIVARRTLTTQPVLTDLRTFAGLSESVGLAHICVSSTEAAFRVVFAPTMADSLLYYPHETSLYDEARAALAPYRALHGADLKTALRQNTRLNVLAAALIAKQALVRFERENMPLDPLRITASIGALYHDVADYPFPNDVPITTTQEAENFGRLVGLLYTRSDLMP